MTKYLWRAGVAVSALLVPLLAAGQTILSSTALQTDIGPSTANAIFAHGSSLSVGQVAFIFDATPETVLVTAISGTRVTLQRGYGGPASPHRIGALVYYGATGSFQTSDATPGASCSGAAVEPYINIRTGHVYQCVSAVWTQLVTPGIPETGTGPAVLATSPTLTTPTINAATITGAVTFATSPSGVRQSARSPDQNVDNGAASTVDHVIIVPQSAVTITGVRLVYTQETAGTIAAGTWQVGTTVGGTQIVAAAAYTNSAAVGTETVGTIVSGAVSAGTPVIFRHTGVAAVAAGVVYVEVDFDYD